MKTTIKKVNEYRDIVMENAAGMKLTLCTLGAAIRDIEVPDKSGKTVSVVLRPESEEIYREKYYGKTIGRTAGRIGNATFTVGGKTAYLEKNNKGEDNLHGGKTGFHSKVFSYEEKAGDGYTDAVFKYFSPDGEGGYFGNVDVTVTYRVWENKNTFRIIYDATADTETLLNLTNHVFLNMGGNLSESVKDETLYINADRIADLDERLIVKGMIPVSREMDFSAPHAIGDYIMSEEAQRYTHGYDHPYLLKESGMDKVACALYSHKSKIGLKIYTTYPCVVFYANSCPKEGMALAGGKTDEQYLCACLECEHFSDGIKSGDTSAVISPSKPYHEEAEYEFIIA